VADDTNNTDEPAPSWEQTLAIWHQKLAELDPATAPQDRSLVDAVIAHLDCDILDDEQECAWRRYAYHAAGHLYAADDPRTATAATDYADSLQACDLYHQALPVQHEVVAFHRRAGDIAALLMARAQYARLLHATGHCHDAAREITSIWNLWRCDWNDDTDIGRPLLDTMLDILLGCDRVSDARDVLVQAPRAVAIGRVRIRNGDTGLTKGPAAHATVCTYPVSTARTVTAL
jgi:hypothetical protein